jgi:hypothetical protein
MANYYGKVRTNYFAVKDPEAFREEIAKYPVELITRETENGELLFGFLDTDEGGLPVSTYDENDEDIDIIWEDVFERHLADEWVAIVMEVGSEKHRYFQGFASAYNNKGEFRSISLDDIYDVAKYLGENLTEATY